MKKLPESEQEIMMIIWEYEEPVSRFQVEEKLNVEKNVAPSTILTLLTRLEKKGFIQKVRNGKSNLYVPLVEKENYIGTVGKNMLDKMFQGSLAKFASARLLVPVMDRCLLSARRGPDRLHGSGAT